MFETPSPIRALTVHKFRGKLAGDCFRNLTVSRTRQIEIEGCVAYPAWRSGHVPGVEQHADISRAVWYSMRG